MSNHVTLDANHPQSVALPNGRGLLPAYLFTPEELTAVNVAIRARRPLLIRAEPGHPKREFALGVAQLLRHGFFEVDVDETESFNDLLWHVDDDMRRAEANLVSMLVTDEEALRERLDLRRFIRPGPIWWSFDPESAQNYSLEMPPLPPDCTHPQFVLFVGDIDYCDDRYLRRLGRLVRRGYFDAPAGVRVSRAAESLIILATNEDRVLPETFLRDCLILTIDFPPLEGLMDWSASSFPQISREVSELAARMVLRDRQYSLSRAATPPGVMEYLDMLRAVAEQSTNEDEQLKFLGSLDAFLSTGHPADAEEAQHESVSSQRHADVFISYASAIEEAFVDRLHHFLIAEGFNAIIDKVDVSYRDSLGSYIESLGQGAAIVAIISDKYLRSPWCMWELLQIHEAKQFRERVFPIVLPDANITDGIGRLEYAEIWEKRRLELDAAMRKVGPLSISEATVAEGKRIRDFADKVDLLAAMVADMSFRAMDDLGDSALESLSKSLVKRFREIHVGRTNPNNNRVNRSGESGET